MKNTNFNLCFCLILFLFGSCKKEEIDVNKAIVGTWELRQTSGGMLRDSTYVVGNGNILKFTNNHFEQYNKGQLLIAGEYIILKDVLIDPNECLPLNHGSDRIVYNQDYSLKPFIQISGNRLTIISGCVALDGGSAIYEKQ